MILVVVMTKMKMWVSMTITLAMTMAMILMTVLQVVKMLVVVVVLFAICWGPVLINNVLVAVGVLDHLHYGYLKPVRQAMYLMSYLNSCLNPLVYGFMSSHFRASFRHACLSCCFFRRRMRTPYDPTSFRSRTMVTSFRTQPERVRMSARRKIFQTHVGRANGHGDDDGGDFDGDTLSQSPDVP